MHLLYGPHNTEDHVAYTISIKRHLILLHFKAFHLVDTASYCHPHGSSLGEVHECNKRRDSKSLNLSEAKVLFGILDYAILTNKSHVLKKQDQTYS